MIFLAIFLNSNRYCLVGPLSASAETEVEYIAPTSAVMSNTIKSMNSQGIKVCSLSSPPLLFALTKLLTSWIIWLVFRCFMEGG